MTTHYDVTTPVVGRDGITRFRRIGVAFPNTKDDAKSFLRIQLDALPLNGELVLFEPTPKDGEPQG